MKVWKKLAGVVLALAVMMTLCVMASADNTNSLTNGGVESNSDKSSVGTTITIPKAITLHGTVDSVYSPAVTYTYSIAAVTASDLTGKTVTDSDNGVGTVKSGPSDGVTLTDNSAAFTSTLTSLTSNTATVTDTITVSVDISKFNVTTYGPGIYRYAITGDNDTAVGNAGVTASGAATRDNRYLDVYIKNGTSTLEVYGFVLLTANESIDSSNATTYKSSGFATDDYHTIDVQLTKSITGDAANKTHQFPFAVTVSNNGLSYSYAKGSATLANDGSTTALTTTLADTEVFYIKGLNPLATVTYVETNDTPDTYLVSIKNSANGAINSITSVATAKDATQSTGALAVSDYSTTVSTTAPVASNNAAVTFINNLEAISPTGVVLRYAPYLAMMGAGVVALPLSMRKKKEEMF